MSEYNPKFIRRWRDTFLEKFGKEGKEAADEWAARTLTPEAIKEVAKILHQANGKK